ncbi:unnamed protein product (macronuclear) [Paramecium tetraurelia]|uniref:Large ribosomal subunit protein bL12 C-terminal domain-containing protein n=1 Tax=Paramecium tetraurelia TaxID=5888 RepID=A0BSI2_PARTE|nr:uncharacterized protein GSPATT00031731001 [Paramecium tetraurelia]CAK61499.1 unnamed protein product [Paramecium tetraurelia]|eukprot:XP_001428897.1 hypothetical protein (macronuclear) [Paramecium tetraurelia strain d4-2]
MQRAVRFGCSTINKLESELNKIEKISFKERYLSFQREWNEFKNRAKEMYQFELINLVFRPPRVFNDKLDANQQKKINLLAKHIEYLSENEFQYLNYILQKQVLNKPDYAEFSLGISKDDAQVGPGVWPTAHPQWLQQQEIIAKLWPLGQQGIATLFSEVVGFGGGVGTGGAQTAATTQDQPKEEKKEQAPKEAPKEAAKANYDVILDSIDAAQKIKIIKDVRAVFNLGLKEAKDLVEKLPATLSKQMKKDDADELKKKLEAIGCTIKLV